MNRLLLTMLAACLAISISGGVMIALSFRAPDGANEAQEEAASSGLFVTSEQAGPSAPVFWPPEPPRAADSGPWVLRCELHPGREPACTWSSR